MTIKIKIDRPIRSNYYDDDDLREFGVSPAEVERALEKAAGEDILIEVNSPGGIIVPGLEIYNRILGYREKYPKAKVTARVLGMAASMATVVAMSADRVEVNTASVWMVHNAWNIAIGDYRDLQKESAILKGFSQMIAALYTERKKTDKDSKYYQGLMDEESWLFGKEIIDAGFADAAWGAADQQTAVKQNRINDAKSTYQAFLNEVRKSSERTEDYEKIAAMLPVEKKPEILTAGRQAALNLKQEEKTMGDEAKVTQKQVDEAYDRGRADGKKELQNKITKATKYLSAEYPESIKNLGIKVLNGEERSAALVGAVTIWDAQQEAEKSEIAKKETGPDVSADKLNTLGKGGAAGYAETETDFQNEMKRMNLRRDK